jgi:hypothetical protein
MTHVTKTTITSAMMSIVMIICYVGYAIVYNLPLWLNLMGPGCLIIFSLWFCKKTLG